MARSRHLLNILTLAVLSAMSLQTASLAQAQQESDIQGNQTVEIEELAGLLTSGELESADRIYVAALILQKQGRHAEAIPVLSKLISFNPDNLAYRKSLLNSLISEKQYERAEYQMDEFCRIDPNNCRYYKGIRAQIWELKPTRLKYNFSVGPSSNVNRATSNSQAPDIGGIEGQINVREESGVFFFGSLSAEHRVQLGNGFHLELEGSLAQWFYSQPDFDRGSLEASFAVERTTENGFWKISPTISYNHYRREVNNSMVTGVEFSLGRQVSRPLFLKFSAVASSIKYESDENSFLDGRSYSSTAGFRYSPSSATSIFGNLRAKRNIVQSDSFSYKSAYSALGISHALQSGTRFQLYGSFEERKYDARFSPLIPVVRHDDTFTAGISITSQRLTVMGAAPSINCRYSSTISNIVFFDDIDVRECDLSFTRRF